MDPCYYQTVTPIGSSDVTILGKAGGSLASINKPSVSRTEGSALTNMSRGGGSMARTVGSLASIGRTGGSVASTGQTTIDWSCKSCDLTMETYSCFSMCNSDRGEQRDTDIRDLAERETIKEKEIAEQKEAFARKEFLEKREMLDTKERHPARAPQVSMKEESSRMRSQVAEEPSPSWDTKTYGEPLWKRGDLDLELD